MYIALFLLLQTVLGANILHIAPVGSPSHHIWNRALAFGLIKKGHNVTMLSHFEEKEKFKNFHIILLEGFFDKTYEFFSIDSVQPNKFLDIKTVYDLSLFSCEHDLDTQGFKTLMNYPKDFTFDLIIMDITIQQCLYTLIERFKNPPVVAVTPFLLPPVLSHLFGNPLQAAYMPYYNTLHIDRMSFLQRITNFLLIHSEILYRKYIVIPAESKLAKKHFGKNIQSFDEIERNMSILISNYDPILCFPLALPPNIIPAGGLHIDSVKSLPNVSNKHAISYIIQILQDLKTIVENAKEGLIIFTLGSYLRSDQMSVSKRTAILNAFAKLPQTVFWKFESEIDDLPKNVIIRKWLPQNDILGDPKTKLLITHGGGLSTQEAMYHGIPVIAIPFNTDQHSNAGKLASRSMAKILNYEDITTDSLYLAITEILNNPMYSRNIKQLSQRYKDREEHPLNKAVFWVEYVLRHGSANFFNLASRDMYTYQAASYDVIMVLLMGLYLLYSLISFILTSCKFIYHTVYLIST
ncbi:hypothetical protein RI129_003648 [Pyrocoelia pectoralis]|uniref:UDP-glucuronosyltransferase n=1 Tax=Pyrocoelia pectoralis TaxID=417401 RepID=A0AAN7ZUR4_9COLE